MGDAVAPRCRCRVARACLFSVCLLVWRREPVLLLKEMTELTAETECDKYLLTCLLEAQASPCLLLDNLRRWRPKVARRAFGTLSRAAPPRRP